MYLEGERVFGAWRNCYANPTDLRRAGNLQAREVLQATVRCAPHEGVIYRVYVMVPMCHEHRTRELFDFFLKCRDEWFEGLAVRVVDGLFESRMSMKAYDHR